MGAPKNIGQKGRGEIIYKFFFYGKRYKIIEVNNIVLKKI